MRLLIAVLVVLFIGSFCLAGEERAAPAESRSAEIEPASGAKSETTPHPTPAADPQWARSLVMLIVGLFVAAIPAGLLLRSTIPQEMPDTHSHDEPPGAADDHHADAHGNHH